MKKEKNLFQIPTDMRFADESAVKAFFAMIAGFIGVKVQDFKEHMYHDFGGQFITFYRGYGRNREVFFKVAYGKIIDLNSLEIKEKFEYMKGFIERELSTISATERWEKKIIKMIKPGKFFDPDYIQIRDIDDDEIMIELDVKREAMSKRIRIRSRAVNIVINNLTNKVKRTDYELDMPSVDGRKEAQMLVKALPGAIGRLEYNINQVVKGINKIK